jgi:hypothetical protein
VNADIARLVLDIPGMTAAQGQELAERIGHGLTTAGGEPTALDNISVTVPEGVAADLDALAAHIVAALCARLG